MPIRMHGETKIWRRRTSATQWAQWAGWLFGMAVFAWCWRLISDKTIRMFVSDSPEQPMDLLNRMVPPKWGYMDTLWDTINIATLGTAMALVMAVPSAFCAARNTTPVLFVRPVALFIIVSSRLVSSRSINSLIWALMLVTLIGPGVFAGVLAIGFRSIGFVPNCYTKRLRRLTRRRLRL